MDHLIFVVRSKQDEELGSTSLSNHELREFLAVQDGT